ncbi:MAG: radical SAM protein [bacterium]|nr:radical SAM protein [bacterium]
MTTISTAPVYKLNELNNLFIELTSKNCNKRCQNCYIKFPMEKTVKDFISVDKIKTTLVETAKENLYCIYLTGAEPMMHPDFNAILRLCLKRCNVCICTNGSFLNEKKIRFLKKVEEEGAVNESYNQIFFRLSLTHHNEFENDKIKYRGHYRQVLFALKTLSEYNFNFVLNLENYYKLDKDEIINELESITKENKINNANIQISCSYPDFEDINFTKPAKITDCMKGRILTQNGVYACPFLAGDYRGRCGLNFSDYSKIISAETEFCATCSKNENTVFSIN